MYILRKLCLLSKRKPLVFVHTICIAVCIIQVIILTRGLIQPTQTVVNTVRMNLTKIRFPLVFKICIKPGFNGSEIVNAGYKSRYWYFRGQSMYNSSIYGWAGHTTGGGVVSNVSVMIPNEFLLKLPNSNQAQLNCVGVGTILWCNFCP